MASPGEIFAQSLQSGIQTGVNLQNMEQQRQQNMAELGERTREFDLTKQLQEKQFDLTRQKTMADLSLMGTQQQLAQVQLGEQQFAAQQLPKIAENQAYINRIQSDPSTFDPENGASNFAKLLADVPNPDVLNPAHAEEIATSIRTRNAQTSLGIAHQNVLATNMNIMAEATQNGIDTTPFLKNPQAPPTADNLDTSALASAVNAKKTERQLTFTQATSDIQSKARIAEIGAQGQQRLDYANALVSGRTSTTWERTLGQQAKNANDQVTQLIKAGASTTEVNEAKLKAAKWNNMLDAYRDSNGFGPSGSMQNPNASPTTPVGNPAQSLWNQSIGQ